MKVSLTWAHKKACNNKEEVVQLIYFFWYIKGIKTNELRF